MGKGMDKKKKENKKKPVKTLKEKRAEKAAKKEEQINTFLPVPGVIFAGLSPEKWCIR